MTEGPTRSAPPAQPLRCAGCGRDLTAETFPAKRGGTFAINFCRAQYLVGVLAATPLLTTVELAHRTGMPYALAVAAMAKARGHGWVMWTAGPIADGKVQYQYTAAPIPPPGCRYAQRYGAA